MIDVVKVTTEDFDQIYPLLLNITGGKNLSRDQWRQIFVDHWNVNQDNFGYALKDDDKIVGFMGIIYSERQINGRRELIGNLTSWIVEKQYRSQSLRLLVYIARNLDCTLSCFTASPGLPPLFKKFGFHELDNRFVFIPVNPLFHPFQNDVELHWEASTIKSFLNQSDLKIFNDHAQFKCFHLLLKDKEDYCYMIATRSKRKRLPFLLIHYISNKDVFLRSINRFNLKICMKCKTIGLLIYEHCLKGKKIFPSIKIGIAQPTMFSSKTLEASDIDTLYSEYFVLNLNSN